jgi:hypothetical protein
MYVRGESTVYPQKHYKPTGKEDELKALNAAVGVSIEEAGAFVNR